MNAYIEPNHGHETMQMEKLFVCCLVDSEWQAINILDLFRAAGFTGNEISLLFRNRPSRADIRPEGADQTRSGPGIAPGVLAGALGWLAGLSVLTIPSLGSFLAAGPIMEELSDWNQRGRCDLTVPLRTFGIAESRAHYYAERLVGGEILIATHPPGLHRAKQAERILSRRGAKNIDSPGRLTSPPEPELVHTDVR